MNAEPSLYFDRQPARDFPALLDLYSRDEFQSPYRSTVPLMALVKEKDTLHNVLTSCQGLMPLDFHFEFKVDHQSQGRGKPSHTDLMAISADACIAIEAKWTEPPYESVTSWLSKGTDNREKVLKGWLSILSLNGAPVSADDVRDCEYQMLHRAASACATASPFGKRPMLAYFKFSSPEMPFSAASTEYYTAALAALHKDLRLADFPMFLVEIQTAPTKQFELIASLPKATPETGASVRIALQQTSLFNFVGYKVQQIGP